MEYIFYLSMTLFSKLFFTHCGILLLECLIVFFMLKAILDSKWPTSKTGQTIVTYLTFTVALFSISPGGKTPWHGEAPNAAQ